MISLSIKSPNSERSMSKPVKPFTPGQEKFGRFFIKNIGKAQVAVYELTGGRLWNTFLGSQVAILTTIGRKSGIARKSPLLYIKDGDNVVVVATQGGMSSYPIWYLNLVANPEVKCQVGSEKRDYICRRASLEEEAKLWPPLDAMYAGYAEYKERIGDRREVPVMILEPK
jgi:deazaflavin-dependent oxidoreductase (nitroreductase family)